MACSKYEYIKDYELPNKILKNCWFVVRIDGHCFHEFTRDHNYEKPNDKRGLDLMNHCAENVMKNMGDIMISYGQSDEYRRKTDLWNRRSDKILTYIVSLFTSTFVVNWNDYFPDTKLIYPPVFDGRIVLYPTNEDIRAYLSWRQVDCHVNNLYNTCFWSLVSRKGMSEKEATEKLKFTLSSDKNELLFQEFGINYNSIPSQFRKGTILYKIKPRNKKSRSDYFLMKDLPKIDNSLEIDQYIEYENRNNTCDDLHEPFHPIWRTQNQQIVIKNIYKCFLDIIQDKFWKENEYLLK